MDPSQNTKKNQKNHVSGAKKQQEQSVVISCNKCTKIFTDQVKFNTHLKSKHSNQNQKPQKFQQDGSHINENSKVDKFTEKKPLKKIPFKNRMMEIHQNQLEDNIYAFLGQLGQKNTQPANSRSEFVSNNQNQRLTGQTNYSLNKVVRTPYQQPIKATDNIPNSQIQKSQHKQFIMNLKEEISILEEKIQAEKQIWQLRDPMAPQEQTQDQFSLMDVRKLIANYPKRNLNLKYPHFSIYMLWIARICKPPAFKEFFMLIGTYLAHFESVPSNRVKDENCYQLWRNYFSSNEDKFIQKQLKENLIICDQKYCNKFIEYFVQWAASFRAIYINQ